MTEFKSPLSSLFFAHKKEKISTKPLSANETLSLIKKYGIEKATIKINDNFGYIITGSLLKVNILLFVDAVVHCNSYADISQKAETRVTYGVDETIKLDGTQSFSRWVVIVIKKAANFNYSLSRNKKGSSYYS